MTDIVRPPFALLSSPPLETFWCYTHGDEGLERWQRSGKISLCRSNEGVCVRRKGKQMNVPRFVMSSSCFCVFIVRFCFLGLSPDVFGGLSWYHMIGVSVLIQNKTTLTYVQTDRSPSFEFETGMLRPWTTCFVSRGCWSRGDGRSICRKERSVSVSYLKSTRHLLSRCILR